MGLPPDRWRPNACLRSNDDRPAGSSRHLTASFVAWDKRQRIPGFACGSTRATPFQFLGRELERSDEVRVGFFAIAETAQHLAQCEVRAPIVFERKARFEIRLRLAPELLALAE